MRFLHRLLPLLAVCLLATSARAQLGTNLLANPSADDSTGSTDNYAACRAPGWSFTGTATACRWAAGGGFPVAGDPGPVVRGPNFFSGGNGGSPSTFSQVLDVSALAATIDAGQLRLMLGGYFGGFSSQNDHAELEVAFLDGLGSQTGGVATPQVLAAQRSSLTALLLRESFAAVPAGTRQLRATLVLTRTEGSYNDGYADSLYVKLVPLSALDAPMAAGELRVRSLSPVPSRGPLRLAVTAPAGSPTRVDLLDVQGRSLQRWTVAPGGRAELSWARGPHAPGVYFVRASSGRAWASLRVVLAD